MATNPITDFLNSYAGKTTRVDTLTASAQADLKKLYEDCYLRINRTLLTATRGVNWWTFGKQTEIMKAIASEIDRFDNLAGKAISQALQDVTKIVTTQAIKDLNLFDDLKQSKSFHFDFNSKYAEQSAQDAYEHIAAQTSRMAESVKAFLRQEATAVFRRSAVEGTTRRQAADDLRESVLSKDPNFEFIDNAGRHWDTEDYFDMLTRTVMMNEARDTYVNTMANEQHDLVAVSIHGTKCDACAQYEGEVLSLTGLTQGYPTLDEAMGEGLFHPRCMHRLVAYDEQIDSVFKQVGEGTPLDEITLPNE